MSEQPHRRPTMRDVADAAGVSFKSVSRVINAEPGVSDELRRRVDAAVVHLGYRRDPAASSLRRLDGRTNTIAIVVDDVANPFSAAVQRGVEDAAALRGVLVLAASSDDDRDREREAIASFVDRRVDGVIVMSAMSVAAMNGSFTTPPLVAGLPLYDTPFVAVDRPMQAQELDVVLVDNRGGAVAATSHLIAHGHERIAFLGDRLTVYTAHERREGYREALDAAGLPRDVRLERPDLHRVGEAKDALLALLSSPKPPTAVFAARNVVTAGAIRALRECGRHHEVALIGFDDFDLADLVEPAVSVIAQSPAMIGREAAGRLFSRIDGDRSPSRRLLVATRLIARGSGELRPRL